MLLSSSDACYRLYNHWSYKLGNIHRKLRIVMMPIFSMIMPTFFFNGGTKGSYTNITRCRLWRQWQDNLAWISDLGYQSQISSVLLSTWSPFYQRGLTLIPPLVINCTHYKVCNENTGPFSNFNGTIEGGDVRSNFIPHFTGHVITYTCLTMNHVSKRGPWCVDRLTE